MKTYRSFNWRYRFLAKSLLTSTQDEDEQAAEPEPRIARILKSKVLARRRVTFSALHLPHLPTLPREGNSLHAATHPTEALAETSPAIDAMSSARIDAPVPMHRLYALLLYSLSTRPFKLRLNSANAGPGFPVQPVRFPYQIPTNGSAKNAGKSPFLGHSPQSELNLLTYSIRQISTSITTGRSTSSAWAVA